MKFKFSHIIVLLLAFVALLADSQAEMVAGIALGITGITGAGIQPIESFAVNGLKTNGTLRHEDYQRWDAAVLTVARRVLNTFNDFKAKGLVVPVDFGTIISMYERASDMTAAAISIDGLARGQNDRLTFDSVGVPVPVIHKGFTLSTRVIEASRRSGTPLSTTQIEVASQIVFETIEDMIFNGVPGLKHDGKSLYGFTTHTGRETVDLTASGWAVVSGRDVLTDVETMLARMITNKKYGPYTLYVASDVWTALQADYKAATRGSFIERILAYPQIEAVKWSQSLTAGNVVMVQLTPENVDMVVAHDVVNVEFGDDPLTKNFLVFGAMAPRIKEDKDGNIGVVHGAP